MNSVLFCYNHASNLSDRILVTWVSSTIDFSIGIRLTAWIKPNARVFINKIVLANLISTLLLICMGNCLDFWSFILIQIFLTISWWAKMHVLAPVGPQSPVPRDHVATTLHKGKKNVYSSTTGWWVVVGGGCGRNWLQVVKFSKKLLKKCGVDRKFTLNANFIFALFRVGVFHANHRQHLNLLLTKAVCSAPCSFL